MSNLNLIEIFFTLTRIVLLYMLSTRIHDKFVISIISNLEINIRGVNIIESL